MSGAARVALAVVLFVTAACGGGRTVERNLDDAQLAVRVKTAILNDVGLGVQPIDVEVAQGVVRLSGSVTSEAAATRAVEVARAVNGVGEVESTLIVDPRALVPPRARERRDQVVGLEPVPALPRTPGWLALGGAVRVAAPGGDDVDAGVGFGPAVRLGGGPGWGPTIGFGWYRTPLATRPDGGEPLADLHVRPILGGMAYTARRDRLATSVALLGGLAFNSLDPDTEAFGPGRAISVSKSLVVRPSITFWYALDRRYSLGVGLDYVVTRPEVTLASDTGVTKQGIKADALLVTASLAYWLF